MNHYTPDEDRITALHRVRNRLAEMDHHRLHRARLRFRQLLADGLDPTIAAMQAVRAGAGMGDDCDGSFLAGAGGTGKKVAVSDPE